MWSFTFLLLIVLLFGLPDYAQAHTNSSLTRPVLNSTSKAEPLKRLGWVPEPNCSRGTAGIIYSCLTTMLICTWTVQHVDIPATSAKTPVHSSRFRFKAHKLRWALLTLIAPEITAFTAASDFMRARSIGRRVRNNGVESWGPVQSSFAAMGGLRLHIGDEEVLRDSNAAMEEFLGTGGVPSLRNISTRDIQDRDKGSYVVKTIACLQVLWFVIQLICRRTQDLPSSILEVTTMVFVAFSLVSFLLWWRKPQDVECYVLVEPSPKQHEAAAAGRSKSSTAREPQQCMARVVLISLFGGLHFLPWDADFPSPIERDLWRGACVAMAVLPVFCWCLRSSEKDSAVPLEKQARMLVFSVGAFVYVISRLFIIVEAFVQFRAMPAEVFQSVQLPWSRYFPHIE